MKNLNEIVEEMKRHSMSMPAKRVYIEIPDSKKVLEYYLKYFILLEGKDPEWIKAYDEVADWLSDNKGKGLFLYGNVGLGKTVLARLVLPAILLRYERKVVTVYDAQEMNDKLKEVLKKKIICLDDVGTEEIKFEYGNKRIAFYEVLDAAEKQGKLLIITTNYTQKELEDKYGDRAIDRIMGITRRVLFTGKSFRGR